MNTKERLLTILLLIIISVSCTKVETERIPDVQVRIDISLAQQSNNDWWVAAPTDYVSYLYPSFPDGFPYTATSRTGYGGVILVCGYDNARYAFDLACPVEANPEVRIYVDGNEGHCRTCGSTFDLFWGSGAPTSGVAAERNYPLKRYYINYISVDQSYMIVNY